MPAACILSAERTWRLDMAYNAAIQTMVTGLQGITVIFWWVSHETLAVCADLDLLFNRHPFHSIVA